MGNLGFQELLLIFIVIGLPVALIIFLVKLFSKPNKPTKTSSNISLADELEKLNSLKEKGVITQEEFDNKKSKLLQS